MQAVPSLPITPFGVWVWLVFVTFLLHCNSASHCVANLELSLIIRTVKGNVSKGVVTQRHVSGCLFTLLTEHPLSEHFAKQQSPIMIPSHIVIYLHH